MGSYTGFKVDLNIETASPSCRFERMPQSLTIHPISAAMLLHATQAGEDSNHRVGAGPGRVSRVIQSTQDDAERAFAFWQHPCSRMLLLPFSGKKSTCNLLQVGIDAAVRRSVRMSGLAQRCMALTLPLCIGAVLRLYRLVGPT